MAELKRNFSQAKMNKDMDERVIGPGQYRDANNIQISTSEGSAVGTVQTLLGNTERTGGFVPGDFSVCVGAIEVGEKDKIYYLVSGEGDTTSSTVPNISKDYIIEYDSILRTSKYVFVDIFEVIENATVANQAAGENWFAISDNGDGVINTTGVRTGMQLRGTFTNNTGAAFTFFGTSIANSATYTITNDHLIMVTDVVHDAANNRWKIYHDFNWQVGATLLPHAINEKIVFEPDGGKARGRVLQFNPHVKINAINHLDGMLFWTDGVTEPKKIHIEKSISGTGGLTISNGWDNAQKSNHVNNTGISYATARQVGIFVANNNAHFHTRLVIKNPMLANQYILATNRSQTSREDVTRENVTVIKKSPLIALTMDISSSLADRIPDASASNPSPPANSISSVITDASGAPILKKFSDSSGNVFPSGTTGSFFTALPVDFRVGDTIIMSADSGIVAGQNWDPDLAEVTVKITSGGGGGQPNVITTGSYGYIILTVSPALDGVAGQTWFVKLKEKEPMFEFKFPRFSYRYRYDDGEYSTFAPFTQVAFLPGPFDYRAKKGHNLGMTNSVRSVVLRDYFNEYTVVPKDVVGIDLLYKEDGKPTVYTIKSLTSKSNPPEWPDRATSNRNRGRFVLDTEMIHAVVPANQILRPWDNVPKSAKAQEITANRLIYGNYKQGYDITGKISLDIQSDSKYPGGGSPLTSMKSLRTYQVGIVFADEYGRETPVLVPKKGSTFTLNKETSIYQNCIKAKFPYPTAIPPWAQYLKYYVKETSNEYYNLTQDRWYDAEDGNVWLSFPSAERNKVDEDTFLILKNEYDTDVAVTDKARYKIIAIENDAPLFIKTAQKLIGQAVCIEQMTAAPNNQLSTDTTIFFTVTNFKTGYGDSFYADKLPKIAAGNLYARVVGILSDIVASRWVGVTSIDFDSTSTQFRIRLDEAIGDTADMVPIFSNPAAYKIELREDAVTHKAEFDGRFFVKILKDAAVSKFIMKIETTAPQFNVVNSYNLRSVIAPGSSGQPGTSYEEDKHPSQNIAGHTYHTGNATWAASGGFDNNHKFGFCGGLDETRDFWQQYRARGAAGKHVFIDAARFINDDINWQSGCGSWPHIYQGSDESGMHGSYTGTYNQTNGRGIKQTSNGKAQIWFGMMDWGNDHNSTQVKFRSQMRTLGTLFKFRDDPANIVYRVTKNKGRAQVGNFVKNTINCNRCKSSEKGCKRDIFSIEFERLDGLLPGTVPGAGPNTGVIDYTTWDPLSAMKHDGTSATQLDVLEIDISSTEGGRNGLSTDEPAIWETEPKEDVGLDIYYEASGSFPLDITHKNNELFIPLGSTVMFRRGTYVSGTNGNTVVAQEHGPYSITAVNSTGNPDTTFITVSGIPLDAADETTNIDHDSYASIYRPDGSTVTVYVGKATGNYIPTGSSMQITVMTGKNPANLNSGSTQPWRSPIYQPFYLNWHNCWKFGNGVESDRIRDDYNQSQLDNGVKASTVLSTPYAEEHKGSGLIFSGIYNSNSGVNDLNQFIQAEPITKDLNPRHGTIQALVTRDTNTVVFCEDKVLSILTNKDALFNADGNSNVTSNTAVLGQAVPMSGEYGISTHPESLAVTSTTMYWCDQARGQVLSLDGNVVQPISNVGMKDFWTDNLKGISHAEGSFDDNKDEYNLTLKTQVYASQYRPDFKLTASFSETVKGWSSFKSFNPEVGVSLNNEYYTFDKGSLWQHHTNTTRNNFYGVQSTSDVTTIFNDQPGSVKSFNTLNYEGTQSRISLFTGIAATNAAGVSLGNLSNNNYKDLTAKSGWYVDNIKTDLQEAENLEFKNKEGKWFSTIKGAATTLTNLDGTEFSVQGLGGATCASTGTPSVPFRLIVKPHNTNAAGSTNWDSTADSSAWRVVSPAVIPEFTQGSTVPAGSVIHTIDNLTLNSGGILVYSGFDMSAEDFEVPTLNNNNPTSGTGWNTIYIWNAVNAAGGNPAWNADTVFSGSTNTVVSGITKVEFKNIGPQGPSNQVQVEIFYASFTMPANDVHLYCDVDVKASVVLPPSLGNVLRNSSFVVSSPD